MMRCTFIALLLAATACKHDKAAAQGSAEINAGTDRVAVELAQVAPAPPHWTDEIPARIVFDEAHTSRVGAPLGGRVAAVNVELGQRVKAGSPLFSVTSGDLAELRAAEAKAKVDLDAARTNFARVKSLVDAKALPQKELIQAQQDLAEAEVALRTAQSKLASLKFGAAGETNFTISAPREGVIVEKTIAVGQQVSPDAGAVIAIADLTDVWVVADLLEDAVDDITTGTKAEVTLDGADTKLTGVVDQVSAIVDPDRHTVPVRVKLDNPSGALRPNAIAQIRFLEDKGGLLSVPADAILSDGANTYVYVMRNGKPERQNIVAGPRNAKLVPVRSGLQAGDQVVARGASLLENQLPLDQGSSK
jgi:RND family efflux transporter MFP subunit